MQYCLLSPICLAPTEEVDPERVAELQAKILQADRWTAPITAEKDALFVMDGYHQLTVAHRLGLAAVPVILLNYGTVRVESWRQGETIAMQFIGLKAAFPLVSIIYALSSLITLGIWLKARSPTVAGTRP